MPLPSIQYGISRNYSKLSIHFTYSMLLNQFINIRYQKGLPYHSITPECQTSLARYLFNIEILSYFCSFYTLYLVLSAIRYNQSVNNFEINATSRIACSESLH